MRLVDVVFSNNELCMSNCYCWKNNILQMWLENPYLKVLFVNLLKSPHDVFLQLSFCLTVNIVTIVQLGKIFNTLLCQLIGKFFHIALML